MNIGSVVHRGLRRLIERDDPAGLPPASTEKIRNILSFLGDMEDETELGTVPVWRAHRLTGDRRGTWSLAVTRNWRLTFRIDAANREIVDLDLEDYH